MSFTISNDILRKSDLQNPNINLGLGSSRTNNKQNSISIGLLAGMYNQGRILFSTLE